MEVIKLNSTYTLFDTLKSSEGIPRSGCLVILHKVSTNAEVARTTSDDKGFYKIVINNLSGDYQLKIYGAGTTPKFKPDGDWETITIGGGGGSTDAADIVVNATSFSGNLSSADDTVQKALETIDAMVAGGGSGEANTASNLGSDGEGIFAQKSGVDLQFKKLIAGDNISFVTSATGITIKATAIAYVGVFSLIASNDKVMSLFNLVAENVELI